MSRCTLGSGGTYLDCSYRQLFGVPCDVPESVTGLFVSLPRTLSPADVSSVLSGNFIQKIDTDDFKGLPNIVYLFVVCLLSRACSHSRRVMNANRLTSIATGAFNGLAQLSFLFGITARLMYALTRAETCSQTRSRCSLRVLWTRALLPQSTCR